MGPPLLVSIVVPTYNRIDRLKRVLAALDEQSIESDVAEIIVVSDGSTDGTAELLGTAISRFTLHAVMQDNQGPAAARNAGLARASAPLVLFIDDDVIATPTLVAEHLAAHGRFADDVVVIGPMLTPPDTDLQPWIEWEQRMLDKQYDAMISGAWEATARQFYTGNASLSRQLVVDAGAFDTSFRRAEDVEFAYRLKDRGVQFVFEPRAVGFHHAERSFESWLSNARDYGRNDVIFARERNQQWLLEVIGSEFAHHNPISRWNTRACLRWPWLHAISSKTLILTARAASRMRVQPVAQAAFSGVYSSSYYAGVANELGSGAAVLALFDKERS